MGTERREALDGNPDSAMATPPDHDQRLRLTLEAAAAGTWDWDIVQDRIEWSSEIDASHGVASRQRPMSFRDYLALIHPDDRPLVRAAVDAAVTEQLPYDIEFRIVRPDGTVRWTHGAGRVMFDPAGSPVRMIGISLDITARKRAEAERDRLVEAEREAARLRDAFIGVVSHELRTPITTIFGGTRVLGRRWREMDPDARDAILTDIVEESDRLYRLVEDLLVLTRVERGTLEVGDEPIHLVRLVGRVTASERARWPGVTFVVDVPPELPAVAGEDTYLEQVLRNLLGNAGKYGGPGTTVTVRGAADERWVRLEVADEGPGIDEAEAERLFELFYRSPTVSGVAPGAGIGLFVCRHLVTAMGGTVHASRRPEGGAVFTIALPRYVEDDIG